MEYINSSSYDNILTATQQLNNGCLIYTYMHAYIRTYIFKKQPGPLMSMLGLINDPEKIDNCGVS